MLASCCSVASLRFQIPPSVVSARTVELLWIIVPLRLRYLKWSKCLHMLNTDLTTNTQIAVSYS